MNNSRLFRSSQIKFSSREREVLDLIIHEYSTTEIASKLYLSFETIKSHRRNIKSKLKVRNVAGMVREAFALNLYNV